MYYIYIYIYIYKNGHKLPKLSMSQPQHCVEDIKKTKVLKK